MAVLRILLNQVWAKLLNFNKLILGGYRSHIALVSGSYKWERWWEVRLDGFNYFLFYSSPPIVSDSLWVVVSCPIPPASP